MSSIDVIGSQLDVASIVNKLMELERIPVYRLEDQIAAMQKKVNAYQNLNTRLSGLANSVNMLLYGSTSAPFIKPGNFNQRVDTSIFGARTVTSSNENVLTATAAGKIAAGSYSLTVNKLAQAKTTVSVGFADINKEIGPISGNITLGGKSIDINLGTTKQAAKFVSDEVSGEIGVNGTITLTPKNGDAVDVEVEENDTLATLVTKINNAVDPGSKIEANIVDNKLEITSIEGTAYSFTVTVKNEEIPPEDGEAVPGLSEKLGITQTQQAKDNPTLIDLRDAINDAASQKGLGINATIVNTGAYSSVTNTITGLPEIVGGYKLMISSKETGKANEFTISGGLASPGVFGWDDTQEAQDAQLTINNITINSSSNTVKDAIEGVTINLKNVTKENETVKIEIGIDNDTIVSAVKDMISAYNAVSSFINAQFNYSTTSSTDSLGQKQMTVSAGPLSGDATLRSIQSTLQSLLSGGIMSGESYAYRSITQVGITYDKDGSLSLDEAKLKEALSKDFDAVAGFFLGYDQTVNAGTSEEKTVRVGGMLTNMGESLKGLTDPLRNPIKNALSGLDNNIRNLQDSIAAYELRLQTREDLLYTQFSAADEALRMMRVTLGNISGALASLTNNSN